MNELAGATVSPQAAPAQEAAAPAFELPSPLADVAQGLVPAITLEPINDGKTDPLQAFTIQHFEELAASGLDYHEIPDTQHSVLFNPTKITPEQIDEAHEAGKLFEIAPVAKELGKPVAAPAAAAPAASQVSMPAAPLAGATVNLPKNSSLETARLRNAAAAPKNAPNPVPNQLAKRPI